MQTTQSDGPSLLRNLKQYSPRERFFFFMIDRDMEEDRILQSPATSSRDSEPDELSASCRLTCSSYATEFFYRSPGKRNGIHREVD
jgi:hypothetical protein